MKQETARNHQNRLFNLLKDCYQTAKNFKVHTKTLTEMKQVKVYNDPAYQKVPYWVQSYISGADKVLFDSMFNNVEWVHPWNGKVYKFTELPDAGKKWYLDPEHKKDRTGLHVWKKFPHKIYTGTLEQLQAGRAYMVTHNVSNNMITITEVKTDKKWQLQPYEFVYGSANFNETVDMFPDYVHKMVWEFSDAHSKLMRESK